MSLIESSSRFGGVTATWIGFGDFSASIITPSPAIKVGSKGETGADDPSPVRLAKKNNSKFFKNELKI